MADLSRFGAGGGCRAGCTTLLNRRLGPTAAGGFRLFEQGVEFLHDLGFLRVEIRRLAGIIREVVELGGGFGIGVG